MENQKTGKKIPFDTGMGIDSTKGKNGVKADVHVNCYCKLCKPRNGIYGNRPQKDEA